MFVWMALKADDDGVGSAKGNTVSYDIGSNRLRYRKQIVRQCLSAVQLYGITRSLCQLKYSQLLHNCTKKIAFVYTVLFVGVIVYYKNKTDFSLSFLDVT